jgi:hypothetical protein
MANDNQIGLQAVFENKEFQDGINSYNSSIDNAVANTDDAGSSMSQVWTGLSTVGAAAWAGLAAGIAAVTVELGLATAAAIESETIMTRVNFIIDAVGERSGVNAEFVNELVSSMSQVVPFDDEIIAQAAAVGLSFEGVNKDNLQPLLSAAADLSVFTGKDLPSSMKELALAISDPDKAMRLLKDANITLTDQEMKTLKGFKDVGDGAGATTFLLGKLKDNGILGLGEAMGDTAAGKLTIMQTALGNLQESLGAGLLDALKGVFDRITEFANNPKVIGFLTELGARIGDVVEGILNKLPDMFATLEGVIEWLKNNKPIIIGILAAIGVAMAAFAISSAAAAIATAASFAPVIAVLAVIAAVVAIFVKAWQEDWGGIQGKVADAWAQVKPVFDELKAWLAENLPEAIAKLKEFWENKLLPAIKKVFIWLSDTLIPLFVKLVYWLKENLPKAIQKLSDFWTNTLQPAIKKVSDWIENTLIPILKKIWDWLSDNLPKAIQKLSDFWNNTLLPAIKAVADFFNNTLLPAFKKIADFISTTFTTVTQALSDLWNNVLLPAITAVWYFIQTYLMPIFEALADFMDATLGLAVRVLAAVWERLSDALGRVWDWVKNKVMDAFTQLKDQMDGPITKAVEALQKVWDAFKQKVGDLWDKLEPFRVFLANIFKKALDGIWEVIENIISKIGEWADAIRNLKLPDWLTPGSPTPLEIGLVGINAQLDKLARASLPAIRHQMEVMATVQDIPGTAARGVGNSVSNSSQSTRNYVYGASFNIPNAGGFIESLQGL